jgi:putative proteasome-type protease
MTYCLSIKVNDGLVFASDSRTNAGVDYVNTYSKMFRFEIDAGRCFVIITSGNLSTSQGVIQQLRRDLDDPNAAFSLRTADSLYSAASYLGQTSQVVQARHDDALQKSGINGESYFIIGGEISGQAPDIYLVYAQGNCISPSSDNPFLQIGETKYGKPILDRVIAPLTTLEDASRAALVSIDSTIRSNITVGPPIELCILRNGEFRISNYMKLNDEDSFYNAVRQHWNEGLRLAFGNLPRFPWEGMAPAEVQRETGSDRPIESEGAASQPQELSEQVWSRQLLG